MITQTLLDDAAMLLDGCRAKQVKLATTETCTGGLIAAVLTAVAGSFRTAWQNVASPPIRTRPRSSCSACRPSWPARWPSQWCGSWSRVR
jgi:hypothetical protein